MNPRLKHLINRASSANALAIRIRKHMIGNGFDEDAKPNEQSLGAYVSQLRNGNDRWWRGEGQTRELARKGLAHVLGIPLHDLGLVDGPLEEVDLEEFPALGPLHVKQALPADLGTPDLFSPPARGGCEWWLVDHGFGKTLAARWLRARGDTNVFFGRTLKGVLAELPFDGTLIVDLDAPASEEDFDLLEEIAFRGHGRLRVRVMCTRGLPDRDAREEEQSNKSSSTKAQEQNHGGRKLPKGWKQCRWNPANDWIERLASWIVNRIGRSRLTAQQLTDYFGDLYKWHFHLRSPAQLLPFAEYAQDAGPDVLHADLDLSFTDEFLRRRIHRRAGTEDRTAEWLAISPTEKLLGMLRTHLFNAQDGLRTPHPTHTWERLAASIAPPPTAASFEEQAMKIAEGNTTQGQRKKLVKPLSKEFEKGNARAVVANLLASDLLVANIRDDLVLHPHWLSQLLFETLARQIVEEPDDRWWLLLLRGDRARLLRDALEELADERDPRIDELLDQAVQRFDLDTPHTVALATTLVQVCASVLRDPDMEPWPQLPELLSLVRTSELQPYEDTLAAPAFYLALEGKQSITRWITTCWIASLRLERGSWNTDGLDPWMVPGYTEELDLESLPQHVQQYLPYPMAWCENPDDYLAFKESPQGAAYCDALAAANLLVPRLDPDRIDESRLPTLSTLFAPQILFRLLDSNPSKARPIVRTLRQHNAWVFEFEDLLEEATVLRKKIMIALRHQLPVRGDGLLLELNFLHSPRLNSWLLESLDDADMLQILDEDGVGHALARLHDQPSRVVKAVLRWMRELDPARRQAENLDRFLTSADESALYSREDLLEDLCSTARATNRLSIAFSRAFLSQPEAAWKLLQSSRKNSIC